MTNLAIKSSDKKSDSEVDKMSKMEKYGFAEVCIEVSYSQILKLFSGFFGELSTIIYFEKIL